ncbi:MAG: GDP-mannose 4,6-dehydratase [Bryobacteraceae bacterium]|nr:GDP-mannose 4,6-dehydratase [Bryobacteraceae bacterium]
MRNPGFWNSRPVFLTGGTGLMGGWLLKRLLEAGADVVALVRDGVPRSLAAEEGLLDRVTIVHGRLEDYDTIRRSLAEYSIDTVFHLAAQPLVGVAKIDPLSTLEINIRGTWNILEAARVTGAKQIVVASSDKAYGASPVLPYLESHPLQGRYPYDVSKSCADLIAQMYATTYRLPVCIARCANLFGAGDLNFSRVIPGAIQATLNNQRFVIRSDGKFVRGFLYVKDAAESYTHLAEALAENRSLAGEAFNFGLEDKPTVLEIVDTILRIMDRTDLAPVIMNEASAEIREQYLSSQKARDLLNWTPRYSLEAGLRETVDWYRTRLGVPGHELAQAAAR